MSGTGRLMVAIEIRALLSAQQTDSIGFLCATIHRSSHKPVVFVFLGATKPALSIQFSTACLSWRGRYGGVWIARPLKRHPQRNGTLVLEPMLDGCIEEWRRGNRNFCLTAPFPLLPWLTTPRIPGWAPAAPNSAAESTPHYWRNGIQCMYFRTSH